MNITKRRLKNYIILYICIFVIVYFLNTIIFYYTVGSNWLRNQPECKIHLAFINDEHIRNCLGPSDHWYFYLGTPNTWYYYFNNIN